METIDQAGRVVRLLGDHNNGPQQGVRIGLISKRKGEIRSWPFLGRVWVLEKTHRRLASEEEILSSPYFSDGPLSERKYFAQLHRERCWGELDISKIPTISMSGQHPGVYNDYIKGKWSPGFEGVFFLEPWSKQWSFGDGELIFTSPEILSGARAGRWIGEAGKVLTTTRKRAKRKATKKRRGW